MKNQNIKILLYLVCCFSVLSILPGYAQRTSVRATVQPAEILIGEHAIIELEAITPVGRNILFPIFPDTLVNGIEVLLNIPPDTTIADNVMTLKAKYLITSFDSTLYYIPYMPVIDGTDTLKSNSFGLKVTSPELEEHTLAYLDLLNTQQTDSIDFDALGISDIKPIFKAPFVLSDYLQYLLLALLIAIILAIIALGVFFAFRKKNKGYFFKPAVVLPPHVVALKELDKIKSSKIWQQGREKEYYTELTDVLREYIEGRFTINAFEKTSDEILDSIKYQAEAESSTESLTQILKLADLVKFAKYKPLPNENDLSLVNAYLFVNQTKIEPPTPNPENGEQTDQTEDKPIENSSENKTEDNKANS